MQHPLPRMCLLRWLVSSRCVEDEGKRSWLVANMLTRVASLVHAAASEPIVAITATCMRPTLPIVAWLGAGVLLLAWRLGVMALARRGMARGRPTPTGVLCNLSGTPGLPMPCNARTCSIIAGLGARNASTSRWAVAQMIPAISLIGPGAALAPQPWIKVPVEAQLDVVRARGCDEVQGFPPGRPVPASGVPTIGVQAPGPCPPDPSPSAASRPAGRERRDVLVA